MSLHDTGIRPAIDAHIQAQRDEVRDYGNYWSASSAGYCKRKLIFERLGVPPAIEQDPRTQRVFSVGHIFHNWIQDITKEAGLSIASEVELQDEKLMIRGHFDDLILVPGKFDIEEDPGDAIQYEDRPDRLILYDYKTAHSKSFSYTKDRPMSHYHKMQLGTYMYMLRNGVWTADPKSPKIDNTFLGSDLTEARTLTISKDDLRMSEKQLFWSEELERMVLKFWTELNRCWDSQVIPPCECMIHEGGFMAKEKFNPYFYEGQPCSIDYYNKWKEENHVHQSKEK